MQLLNHMEHIHRLAIETMERRIVITNGFQQYLVELKSADDEEKEASPEHSRPSYVFGGLDANSSLQATVEEETKKKIAL